MPVQNSVLFNIAQSKTDQEKAQARSNIGVLHNVKFISNTSSPAPTLAQVQAMLDAGDYVILMYDDGVNPATPLKAQDDSVTVGFPSGWNGTDATEMGVLPGGRYNGSFGLLGTDGRYWTANSYAAAAAHDRRFTSNSSVSSNTNQKTVGYSLRLVKDT